MLGYREGRGGLGGEVVLRDGKYFRLGDRGFFFSFVIVWLGGLRRM